MFRPFTIALFLTSLALPVPLQAQQIKATRFAAQEMLDVYCNGRGRFDATGLIEQDLTGDGQLDLLLFTGGLTCNDGRPACGAIYCDVVIYMGEGQDLVQRASLMTQCAQIGAGNPPPITLCDKDSGPYQIRWNGNGYDMP
ncbi:hypothetical protein [Paracoccus laeviglucosivorans]|uniref:Uncharacterized protein n=1 Tax=Paracoccus laeviglucosivorans TaxID=1197861 RepID=A0A521AV29_9RHOB|nr:hypothetical protein [Paracoccus laeviglucosivorans]SMO38667.1 hypothetical protein SAMN06265221_101396 [Paracoccus laeviglucosivorans]